MAYPIKTTIYELVKTAGNLTDTDLKKELKKAGHDVSDKEINKALFQLEIQGLVSIRWAGKEKRRIETATDKTLRQPHTIW